MLHIEFVVVRAWMLECLYALGTLYLIMLHLYIYIELAVFVMRVMYVEFL